MPAAKPVSEDEFLLLILCLLNEVIDFFFSDDKSDTGLFEKIEKTLTNSTEGKKK